MSKVTGHFIICNKNLENKKRVQPLRNYKTLASYLTGHFVALDQFEIGKKWKGLIKAQNKKASHKLLSTHNIFPQFCVTGCMSAVILSAVNIQIEYKLCYYSPSAETLGWQMLLQT